MRLVAALGLGALFGGRAFAADADEAMGRRVQALLRAHQAEVYACVAGQKGVVAGEALLRVVVGAGGEAARVEVLKVEEGKAAARAAADCVAAAARKWDLSSLEAARGDQVVFPLAFRPERGGAAVGARMRVKELRAGASWDFVSEGALALLVLRGQVVERSSTGQFPALGAGDLFYSDGLNPIHVRAERDATLLLVEGSSVAPRGVAVTPPIVHLRDLPGLPILGGAATVHLYLDAPIEKRPRPFSLQRLCARRGASVPRHEHDADELIYVVSGRAATTLGDHEARSGVGDTITIPRGTAHAMRAEQDLCVVQVYAPPGPEQRFKGTP